MDSTRLPLPLEKLPIPAALDGRSGVNRAPLGVVRQLAADDDLSAIRAWLGEYANSPHTQRHYRKEAERLLLWALLEQGKPLSGLAREDLVAYKSFLADPRPRERWCGPPTPRLSPGWRPFRGQLRPDSQRTALLVINSLFSYLVIGGYLAGNPLALERRRQRYSRVAESVERYLEREQWRSLLETVEELPRADERQRQRYERCRYLLALLYLLGPRVGELANHTMASFRLIRGRWWWCVIGKGEKPARVPVNRDMLEALSRYRRCHGLSPFPEQDDTTPLVLSLDGRAGIGANMIYRVVKDLLGQAADRLAATDPDQARCLRGASTHWLRHTSLSHQAAAGIELLHLQRNARHSKLETTGLYLHTEEERWHEAMEQHRLKP